jgi:hypothetical protein
MVRFAAVDVRFESLADICAAKNHVPFTPKSGHSQCNMECPLWATNGLMRCSNVVWMARRGSVVTSNGVDARSGKLVGPSDTSLRCGEASGSVILCISTEKVVTNRSAGSQFRTGRAS